MYNTANNPIFWSILIIATITIITLIFLFFQPLPFPPGHKKNCPDDDIISIDDEFTIVNRIEDTQLEWLGVTVFFITLAVILRRFEDRAIVTIIFILIAWSVLVVLGLDYIQSRRMAARAGHEVTWRMNFLFFISLVMLTIVSVILYDAIIDNYFTKSKPKQKRGGISWSTH